jgi:hypothetical protein
MIASGGLSGGISSYIAGGNFWAGTRQGLITSGINHAAHWISSFSFGPGDPPNESNSPSNKDVTPWEVGMEWLTGEGPRHRDFTNGDYFTELLREHNHIKSTLTTIKEKIINGNLEKLSGENPYTLGGTGGVWKYLKDYSTLLTGGTTGNLAVTYLGSYQLNWKVTAIFSKSATIQMTVHNSSTAQSGFRLPVIGYTKWYQNSVGKKINNLTKNGPMSKTTQTFKWTENINW